MLQIHIDGASRGNPGEAAFGVYVETPEGAPVAELYGYLGRASNNVAEYQALIHDLPYALGRGATRAAVFQEAAGDDPGKAEAGQGPDGEADHDQAGAHPDHEPEHVRAPGPQGHADPDLVGPARGGVGDHAVDADGDEHEPDAREDRHHQER